MNNVAMNLVATMMQNKFSNSYASSLKGTQSESFTSVLSQSKNSSYEKPIDQKIKMDKYYESHETVGKAVDKMSKVAKKQENLQKLNRNNDVNQTSSNNNEAKVAKNESKEVTDVKEVKEVKEVDMTADEITDELTKVEEELVAELASQLNVDPEEIQSILNELQLTILDLFDMNNLQMFMTEALGVSNPMELLVTDGASEKVQEVMKTLESSAAANPELAKAVNNMTNGQGEDVSLKDNQFAKLMETIQQDSANSNMNQQQSSGEEKTMMEPAKAVLPVNAETSQNASGFEGMLNQVVTQKTETIIMNGSIQTIQTEVTAKDVFDQIVTGMKVQVSEAKSNVTLQLQPHNLGKIALNLATENGSVTGHFVAETEAVKEVIEANLSILKNQLQSQGIEVAEIKITVGSSASFFTGQDEKDNTSNQNFKNNRNKRMKIGNINDILADKLSEEVINNQREVAHENSSIELHA